MPGRQPPDGRTAAPLPTKPPLVRECRGLQLRAGAPGALVEGLEPGGSRHPPDCVSGLAGTWEVVRSPRCVPPWGPVERSRAASEASPERQTLGTHGVGFRDCPRSVCPTVTLWHSLPSPGCLPTSGLPEGSGPGPTGLPKPGGRHQPLPDPMPHEAGEVSAVPPKQTNCPRGGTGMPDYPALCLYSELVSEERKRKCCSKQP